MWWGQLRPAKVRFYKFLTISGSILVGSWPMTERRTGSVEGQQHQPRFLWRGLLIVMPVTVLAAFGILSLRQDRRLVESEVRERARQFADEAVERCWKGLASL